MKTVYVHIGFHKTATTFLQRDIFPHLKNTHYLDEHEKKNALFRDIIYNLIRSNISEEQHKKIREIIDRNKKKIIISMENLSGNPYFTGNSYNDNLNNRYDILKKTKEYFKEYEVKIIVALREQSSLIKSLYSQYVKQGGTENLKGFLAFVNTNAKKAYKKNFFSLYKYSNYLLYIENLFGAKNTHIINFERFKKYKEDVVKELLFFVGETKDFKFDTKRVNISFGKNHILFARGINKLFKSPFTGKGLIPIIRNVPRIGKLNPELITRQGIFFKLFTKKYNLPETLQQKLKSYYKEDNAILKKKWNITL